MDPEQRVLLRDGVPLSLAPKAFDVLLMLVEHAGRVVEKKDLLDTVWRDTFVEEANLSVNVSTLRKVLGEGVIETIPKRGYRFVAPLSPETGEPVSSGGPKAGRRLQRWLYAGVVFLAAAAALAGWRALAHRPYTIAVLPFQNPTGNEVAGVLTDGISRTLSNALSNIGSPALRVKAQALVAAYRGRIDDPVAAGAALGADAVVAGRMIARNGDWLLQTEVISVPDGALLWGTEYPNQNFVSASGVEKAIAEATVTHLPIALSPGERSRLARPGTGNAEAQSLANRAGRQFHRGTPDSLRLSLDYDAKAVDLDPAFAAPYGDIASAWSVLGLTDVVPPAVAHEKAVEWQGKALRLDPTLYQSRIALLGEQATYEWDWRGILKVGSLHPFYRNALTATGRTADLVAYCTRRTRDEPSTFNAYSLALALYFSRRYDEAIEGFARTVEADPSFLWAHLGLGHAYEQKKMYVEAIREIRLALPLKRALGALGHAYALSGKRREALDVLAQLDERARHEYVTPLAFAWVYLGLGDKDRTFEWMRKACETRVPALASLKVEPAFDPLRDDPRFARMLTCVGVE